MNSSHTPSNSRENLTATAPNSQKRFILDRLGGEPLDGSGFESETPAAELPFDWRMFNSPSEGELV